MNIPQTVRVAVTCLYLAVTMTAAEWDHNTEFTNTWVAEIEGGEHVAKRIARDLGYVYEGPVEPFDDHYVFTREDHPEVSKRNSLHLTKRLTDLDEVKWAEQQAIVKREKRGIIPELTVDYIPQDPESVFPELTADYIPQDLDSAISEDHKPYAPRNEYDDWAALLFQELNEEDDNMPSNSLSSSNSKSSSSSSWPAFDWSNLFSSYSPSNWLFSDNWSSSSGSSSSGYGSDKYSSSSSNKPSSASSSSKPSSSSQSSSSNSASYKPPTSSSSNSGSSKPSGSSPSNNYQSYLPDLVANKEGAQQGDASTLGKFPTTPMSSSNLKTYTGTTKHVGSVSTKKSAYDGLFNDPLWSKQWYTQDYRTTNMPVMDHNVVPVYNKGITGKGITVAVVDDGVEHDHPDLLGNFDKSLSYDMCNNKVGSQPDSAYQGHPNSHGTKCAGEIAMVANNNKCGVGIAYNAKVAGIKTLGKRSFDLVEARGLVHKWDTFDIYTNSWGPSDDGMTMEKMGSMVSKSIEKGVTEGRKGKGAIYTFAAGNGRHQDDNCAADGFINNPYTIPIASVSQHGKVCYYSERCSAVFAATYSGGNRYDEKVATIDLNGKCATDFSGTSAATPIATGIIALTLQANPSLTYRDVMHIITMTAEVAPVANNEDIWYKNGRGFWVSNDFGFGLLNADNMVSAAKKWKNVPKKNVCVVSANLKDPQYLTVGETAKIQFKATACSGTKDEVNYLEQIEVASTVDYPYRGALSINIKSPAGTKTNLLETRKSDSSRNGLKEWSIKSVHNWGEDPKGIWVIEVAANALEGVRASSGYVTGFTITFHGTAKKPAHYNNNPVRKYSAFRLPNGKTSQV